MSQRPTLLVVDDEPGILRLLALELPAHGFDLVTAENGIDALARFRERPFDGLLLDIVMPGKTGLELLREVRAESTVPVILLTARDRDLDRTRGMEMGATDYIVKPFQIDELITRIRDVLRPPAERERRIIQVAGQLSVDLESRSLSRNGESLSLSGREWMVLERLGRSLGEPIDADDLLTAVWGPAYAGEREFLELWVARLREHLEPDPAHPVIIVESDGGGYMLVPSRPAASPSV